MYLLVFVVIILVFALIYLKLKLNRQHWTKRGVRQSNNGCILGDNWSAFIGQQSFTEMVEDFYKMCPNTRYSGFYLFLTPTFLVKDPALIKEITVKSFDHFVNHKSFVPEDGNSIFSKNIFSLKNQKWRDMRANMSPAFTSSKMKFMFSLICKNGEQFVQHFLKKNEDSITVELRDIFTRFTNDVIANVAFGVDLDSLESPENEFYLRGRSLTNFSGIIKMMKFFGYYICAPLYKLFKMSPFDESDVNFFSSVILNNIKIREENAITRPDLITILLQAKKDLKLKITNEDIIAQAIGFFFAGFESVAALMCFMSYELGVNPEIQKRLIEEVDKTSEACNGQITYEALSGMTYMDMVVSESLRKWPNVAMTDRLCTKPYTIEPKYPDEKTIHLETDTYVWIPVFALQRDPKYFPDPERFDPERFSTDNKEKIVPYTYLPFGTGPRNCMGSRLALMETKILFFYLLSNFEIVPIEKTQIPLRISKRVLNVTAEGGFWFGLKRRTICSAI